MLRNKLASTVWQPSTMPVADGTTKRSADLGFRSPNPKPCHWLSETTSPATANQRAASLGIHVTVGLARTGADNGKDQPADEVGADRHARRRLCRPGEVYPLTDPSGDTQRLLRDCATSMSPLFVLNAGSCLPWVGALVTAMLAAGGWEG